MMEPVIWRQNMNPANPDQVGGDGGNACGEFQFDNRYELGPFVRWCYEKDPTTYGPFEPYLGMTTELKK